MRRNSSTTMSAPTAIDDGRSYVFMSSEIEGVVPDDLVSRSSSDGLRATVTIDGKDVQAPLVFAHRDESNDLLICVESRALKERLLGALIVNEMVDVTLMDTSFKAHVIRVESDQSHLRILEE